MKWHLASVWESVADAVPEAPAVVHRGVRRTWREYEDRAAKIASALAAAGHGPGTKVGLYAYNSNAYLEAHFGVFKVRGVPINVNYRYNEAELLYLLDNADVDCLIFDARFAPQVSGLRARLPRLRSFIEIEDGSGQHLEDAPSLEAVIASHAPLPRQDYAEDDLYMLYTGGTTGMPKGVMYRQGDFAFAGVMRRYDNLGAPRPESAKAFIADVQRLQAAGEAPVSVPACPLMHGTGLWIGAFSAHHFGGCVVTLANPHFDPDELWKTVEQERATAIAIVGDAFARPMLAALEQAKARGAPYDLSSLTSIVSSGVMFSREVKLGLLEFADIVILDAMGSSEGGLMATSMVSRAVQPVETAQFAKSATAKVFNDRDEEIQPGSEEIGMIANTDLVPIGYYKDPEKSARTFRTINGSRYSFAGDFAKVAADGTLILLGRGSGCINTGGEKVFPEEVEEAVKAHPDVADCLVVGAPDERFGQKIVAVLELRPDRELDEASVLEFVRARLAGYKAPRRLIRVKKVQRAANGKADYAWAKAAALAAMA